MGQITKSFTVPTSYVMLMDEKNGVFSYTKGSHGPRIYIDSLGKQIEWERDATDCNDDPEYSDAFINDNTAMDYTLREGRYIYTTHEIEYDAGDEYGCFGIKDSDGNIVVPEQYESISGFYNGLCAVRSRENHKWGYIDRDGNVVIDFKYFERSNFNQYGVADGNDYLIDTEGNDIPGTEHNGTIEVDEDYRYYVISLETPEESENDCFTQCDIYDTKNREYIAKRVPVLVFLNSYDGEKDIILEAIKFLDGNNSITVHSSTYFSCSDDNGKETTVYKFIT